MKNEKLKERIEEVLIILALMVAVLVVPLTGGTSSLFLYISAILFPALWILRYRQPRQLYITLEKLGKSLLWGILAGVGLTLVRIAIAQAFPLLLAPARMLTKHAADILHVQTISLPTFSLLLFIGAILHSLFYWSFIQSRMLKYSRVLFILPALLFAVAHMHEGSISTIHAFVVGLVASVILMKTENIATNIALEFARIFTIVGLLHIGII